LFAGSDLLKQDRLHGRPAKNMKIMEKIMGTYGFSKKSPVFNHLCKKKPFFNVIK
jgi:hypothetical protein